MIKNHFLKNNLCLSVFLSVLICVFMPIWAGAATLYFKSDVQEIAVDQYFQVDLFLDAHGEEDKSSSSPTEPRLRDEGGKESEALFDFAGARENEEINAVEGKIVFPNDLLEVKEIIDGDSIVSFWTERPSVNTRKDTNMNTNQHEIVFSGIIPGGFKGVLSPYYQGYKPGKILSLIFKTKTTGEDLIILKDVKVLLNDGLGTPTQTSVSAFQFKITTEAPEVVGLLPIKDPDPPEPFELIIAQDPNVFDGKWFLVFNAQDKGSGIDYYAVRETRRKTERQTDAKWVEVESPYLLKDQKLRSFIYVKAVDKAGNERIAMLSPQNPLRWYENYLLWDIIILGLIIIYVVRKFLWVKYTK